ncbi:hypothetical protein OO013_10960 [Mangrovivirga sp. M17]|uniref:HEAT repeat domain-containing protein n=1 Tax=Mangrovivirga halotolerans TaxID=2993936 RepID=A0ABT3RRZ1_9BACT|nr:hypothetical protein [Mangrovivirga halotolerans]MCX2744390.1 hypothetical protein [Mangrovivirga halotolerans]
MQRIIFFVSFFAHFLIFAQEEALVNHFEVVKKGKAESKPLAFYEGFANNPTAIKIIERYAATDDSKLKLEAINAFGAYGVYSTDKQLRSQAVANLALLGNSKDNSVSYKAISMLKRFTPADFAPETKQLLDAYLRGDYPHRSLLIKIIGFAKVQQSTQALEDIALDNSSRNREQWHALVALTRMGNQRAEARLMEAVRKMEVNSDFIYDVVPDLAYTNNEVVYNFLFEIITDQSILCASPNPNVSEKIPCGYGIAEQIAPRIVNFPVAVDASGMFLADDYQAAMDAIIDWIKEDKRLQFVDSKY